MVEEIIDFYVPDYTKSLFVTNFPIELSAAYIQSKLENICSAFGLICGIKCFESEHCKDENFTSAQYAFVQYHSKSAATKAQKELNGRWFIGSRAMKVTFANPKKKQANVMVLPLWKCYNLANYYLGFNGWSVSIVSQEDITHTEDSLQNQRCLRLPETENGNKPDENCNKQINCIRCRVKITFPKYLDICAIGTGLISIATTNRDSEGNLSKSISSRAKSVKLAYQEACRDAYSQLLFVILNTGKLYIEVFRRQTQDDTCDISDELLDNQVQVNILKEEPLSEDKLESD